jgi:DNA-binding MarR family transcriptional regulator
MENNFTALYTKLSRLEWLLHRRRHGRGHGGHGRFTDHTRGQGRVLALLKMQPEISTKDMSYLLGIRQQSLNELLNKLEKAEYVVRTPSEADRRVMMVTLTEKGKAIPQTNADYSGIFDCLSPDEQGALGNLLDRVIASLENQLGIEDDESVESWMNDARARMGDEQFERMMSMGGEFRPHRRDHHHHDRRSDSRGEMF